MSRSEINEEINEQETLEDEIRYGTSEPKLLAKRKQQEKEADEAIMRSIAECRADLEDDFLGEDPIPYSHEDDLHDEDAFDPRYGDFEA